MVIRFRTLLVPVAVVMTLIVGTSRAQAQEARTVWDGVYQEAQAARGKTAFADNCSSCHGLDAARGRAPALSGNRFLNNWEASSVGKLYDKIRTQMPRGNATSVPDEVKVDILAFILQSNSFPPGPSAALAPDGLAGIRIQPKEGLAAPIAGMNVQTVGCLTQGPGKEWLLTNSSEPVRTREHEPSQGADLTAVAATPSGHATIKLLDVFPEPTEHLGHRMEAIGLYITTPASAINVIAFQMVGPSCGK